MQTRDDAQQALDQRIVDFSFYMIQRGEAGHKRGPYLEEYGDIKGIRTIGYGTVTEAGYNHLNYRSGTVTEEQAIILAKTEMQYKLYEKCRSKFKDFDNLLPCYQALILDMTYQGSWTQIVDAFNAGDMQKVYEIVGKNQNKERAAVRMRAVEMGMLVEDALKKAPDAKPEDVAKVIATQLIEQYKHLNGTDLALTKDELALLYYSCYAAYGIEVTPEQAQAFAMSFPEVATGVHGIGYDKTASWTASFGHQPVSYQPSTGTPSRTTIGDMYRRGTGAYVRTDTPSRPRGRLSDRYPAQPGWSVRPIEARIPSERQEIHGDVQYDMTYSSVHQGARPGGRKPDMIVIHSTEDGPNASEQDVLRYLCRNNRKVSAHVVIGRDGTAYMLVPPERTAHHAGDSYWNGKSNLNSCSIGIEVIRSVNEGYTPEQANTLVAVVAQLSKKYDIPADRVLGHDEIAPGRKTDPGKDFDPIWDALAKAGLSFDAATHEDIKRQLGRNHSVHADKLNPALANARAEDSIAYVPNCAVPEGWSVVPLNLDSVSEEAEPDTYMPEEWLANPLNEDPASEETTPSEETEATPVVNPDTKPEEPVQPSEENEDDKAQAAKAERERKEAARQAEKKEAEDKERRAAQEADKKEPGEEAVRSEEAKPDADKPKSDEPSETTSASASEEGKSRPKKSSSKKSKRPSSKKKSTPAVTSDDDKDAKPDQSEPKAGEGQEGEPKKASEPKPEVKGSDSKPDASKAIKGSGAQDITPPPADDKPAEKKKTADKEM